MATNDDQLARLLKRAAAQTQPEPIEPLAAARADAVIRAWRASRSKPAAEETPWLGFAWRGVAAACAVMLATFSLYLSSPESSAIALADATNSADPELAISDSATLLALQP